LRKKGFLDALSVYDVTTDTVIEELGKRRIDRNGTTGLNKLIGSADPNVLASLKKALFGPIDPAGMMGGGGVGSHTPPSPGGSPTAGGTTPATPAASASQAMGQASQSPKCSRHRTSKQKKAKDRIMQRSLTAQNDLEILSMINGLRRPLYRCHWIVIRSDEMSDDLLRLDANEIY